jgi:hypothetical protein
MIDTPIPFSPVLSEYLKIKWKFCPFHLRRLMLAMGRPAQLLLLVVVLALPLLAAADEPQLLLPQSEPCSSADYTFVRDSAAAPVPVDRSLVGATLEDTSFSLYGGGLYSQLIYGTRLVTPRRLVIHRLP